MTTNGTILVVDDAPDSRELQVELLTQAGYQVLQAASGELALAAVGVYPPDLILLDVFMAGMDGFEVCRRLKAQEHTRHIPILLLSAFAGVKTLEQGLHLGAADYLTKPFQKEELLARVATHLALAQRAAALRKANQQLRAEIVVHQQTEAELRKALAQVKTLSGLIPICANCKKIRDDQNYWHQVENYIQHHSEARFTHGFCPDCLKLFSDEPRDQAKPAAARSPKNASKPHEAPPRPSGLAPANQPPQAPPAASGKKKP
jgi:DNA-binding response OmpR family regulator